MANNSSIATVMIILTNDRYVKGEDVVVVDKTETTSSNNNDNDDIMLSGEEGEMVCVDSVI